MIELSVKEGIGTVTLNRPDIRNALGPELVTAIADALDQMEADGEVRAVVLTGAGTTFSAGADLRAMKASAGSSVEANRADAQAMGKLFHRVAEFPKPVVARVAGPAIGGGVGLMAACDIVVASDAAKFQFSEVRLGLVPAMISPFCIARLGPVRARRFFLTGEPLDAATAHACGLVDIVTSSEALDSAVATVVGNLRGAGPAALVAAKKLVHDVTPLDGPAALDYTAKLIADLRVTTEAQEGMAAFLDKRKPDWMD